MGTEDVMANEDEQLLLDDFLLSLGGNLKERTKIEYAKALRKLSNDLGGLRTLTQEDVNAWLSRRQGSLNRAMLKNWIEYMNYPLKMPKNRGTKSTTVPLIIPKEEQAMIIQDVAEHSDNTGYPIATALALECALRRDEVVNVLITGFQWTKWRNELRYDSSAPCELILKGKGNKERTVVVSKDLMTSIVNYMQYIEGDKLFGFDGGRFYRKFNATMKRLGLVKANGKPKYHPHNLRHTQGTQWHEQGVDIMEIRDRLGHVSVATTQLYINPSKEKAISRWKESLKR